jgi:hypothetical protein
MVVSGIITARCLEMPASLELDVVSCLVGEPLAIEWGAFVTKHDLPSPEEVLKPGWKVPKRGDIVRACASSCTTHILCMNDPVEQVTGAIACYNMFGKLLNAGHGDILPSFCDMLIGAGLDMDHTNEKLRDAATAVYAGISDKKLTEFIHPR